MKKIIVIGMSAASVAFVSKLRSFDKESEIICFSGESSLPYNRCLLADFLTREITQTQLQLKPADFYEKNNIILHLNTWVTQIDTQRKRVFAREVWHDYDVLFLGMGCKAATLKFVQQCPEGLQGLFNFHSLQDMENIQKFIEQNQPKNALVIGAGLNGIEAVSSLVQLKIAVGVVELSSHVLPGQVDSVVAAWVQSLAQESGVTLLTGRNAIKICHEKNHVIGLTLNSGTFIPVDMIIVAAGSHINSELLEGTGIAVQDGSVVVDQNMQTNVSGILAAGDLCLVPDMITGKKARSTTWSDAMLQGLCGATSLSLSPRLYPGLIGLRDSYFFGKDFYACGQTIGHHQDIKIVSKVDDQSLKVWYLNDNQLMGFVLIGDISKLAEYKMWYSTQVKIDPNVL